MFDKTSNARSTEFVNGSLTDRNGIIVMAHQFLAVYAASRLHNYIMNLEGLPFDAAMNPESEPIITTYLALRAVGFVMPLETP